MAKAAVVLLLLGGIIAGAWCMCNRQKQRHGTQSPGDLTYVKTSSGLQEEIINYKGMTISFNPELHIPNWVAWELTRDEAAGSEPRADKFYCDPQIKGCATPEDYSGSGYDRGHMAPAGDMKWDSQAMSETFCMTNIVPQDGALNRGTWKKIEEKCRNRVAKDSAIIIVCGPVLSEKPRDFIGSSGVAVPEKFFKVILAPWAEMPYAIAFLTDNGSVAGGMQAAAVTVDRIEAITGHDFFSALPDDVEDKLESTVDFTRWSRMK